MTDTDENKKTTYSIRLWSLSLACWIDIKDIKTEKFLLSFDTGIYETQNDAILKYNQVKNKIKLQHNKQFSEIQIIKETYNADFEYTGIYSAQLIICESLNVPSCCNIL